MSVVFLHGFMGDGRDWAAIASRFPGALTPDLPGHGAAPWPRGCHTLADAADHLAGQLPETFDLAGYSLGGRVALALALRHPGRVRRLALVGASAGVPDPAERSARRREDARRARLLRREGMAAFLAEWEALPLFASRRALPPEARAAWRARRLAQDPRALARAVAACSPAKGVTPVEALAMPTLWLAGADDAKFAALAPGLAARTPHGRHALVPGAGHDVVQERPEALAAALAAFFTPIPTLEELTP